VIFSLLLCIGAHAVAATTALQQVLDQAVARNDKKGVVFEGAAGKLDVARGTALTVDAIFNIASMTKPVGLVECC
jgi:CubicO group peptidase (beta-lactamase class C family)